MRILSTDDGWTPKHVDHLTAGAELSSFPEAFPRFVTRLPRPTLAAAETF